MPHDLINAKPVTAVVKEFFGSSPALAVHGPDQPALRGHAQAAPLGPRAGRPDARARRLRGARRARHALRPHLPDRDAGRSEHRPHRVALDLRARQRVRLRRDAVPQGREGPRHRRGRASTRRSRRRSTSSRRPTRRSTRSGKLRGQHRLLPQGRRVRHGRARGGRPDGRLAEPARLGGRLADPVPRERRRQPRPHGLEHAAPGGAAAPHRTRRSSAPASRASWPATPASPWSPSATASSSRSTPRASSSRPTRPPRPPTWPTRSTSTT